MLSGGRLYVAVMAGGALGAAARYLVSVMMLHATGPAFPWGTLLANVAGSLFIGLYAELTGPDGRLLVGPAARQFVMVGVLGGFTTFSIFSLETALLVMEGRAATGAAYVMASLTLWIPAAWAGQALARPLNRLPRAGG